MDKLYKYRPLSSFLFKELEYREIYFASYKELNDPIDLKAEISFNPKQVNDLEYLIDFMILSHAKGLRNDNRKFSELLSFSQNESKITEFKNHLWKKLSKLDEDTNLNINTILNYINKSLNSIQSRFILNNNYFIKEIERLSNKFLSNSYVTCFSETNDNNLMWSHYASGHQGICIEFNTESRYSFPYEGKHKRSLDFENYKKRISENHYESFTY